MIFDRIKQSLEASHANQFVAIEPSSGECFLGETLSDASALRASDPRPASARVSRRPEGCDPFPHADRFISWSAPVQASSTRY